MTERHHCGKHNLLHEGTICPRCASGLILDAEDEVRRSRNAMDASTFHGRSRTGDAQRRLSELRTAAAGFQQPDPPQVVHPLVGRLATFDYINHRGERATRKVVVTGVDYGANEWYQVPQFYLRCIDTERMVTRSFALGNIVEGTFKVEEP